MEYRILGRTGLKVSVMGIGAGGPSRLGQRDNIKTESESVDIVLQGFDAGINFIDTSEVYDTEDIVGKAVAQRNRDSIIISTKKITRAETFTPEQIVIGLEDSLRRLQTDYIDVYHVHGLRADKYDYCLNEIIPVLQKQQQQGKIRFIGVTESWNSDLNHDMLELAVQDDVWDVLMVGFNMLNQTARDSVLKASIEKNLGILVMFAIRRALSQPEYFRTTIQQLIDEGQIDPTEIDTENPLVHLGISY
jgi:L-galactose dehydrogenase